MIRVGFKIKAFNPKVVANGSKLVFQTGDRGKDKVTRYVSVMCEYDDTLEGMQDREEVILKEINGISLSDYNGKTQTTIFAKLERLANPDVMEYEEVIDIKIEDSDLPF